MINRLSCVKKKYVQDCAHNETQPCFSRHYGGVILQIIYKILRKHPYWAVSSSVWSHFYPVEESLNEENYIFGCFQQPNCQELLGIVPQGIIVVY